jgi:hypothetical protein
MYLVEWLASFFAVEGIIAAIVLWLVQSWQ